MPDRICNQYRWKYFFLFTFCL